MNTARNASTLDGVDLLSNSETTEISYLLSNITNSATQRNDRNEALANIEIGVLAIILYMALFGNIIVVVLLFRKKKQSRMQLFIIHLALADISVAVCQVLPQLIMDITNRFDGNDFLCKLVKYLQVVTMFSSTYVLIMVALDRYMSICHPLTSQIWTTKRVHIMVSVAWIISSLFSVPQFVIFSYGARPNETVYDCLDNFDIENKMWQLQAYVTWIFLAIYAIPFCILTACYTKICHVVWISVNAKETRSLKGKNKLRYCSAKCSNGIEKNLSTSTEEINNPRAHSMKMSKSKIKTIKLTLTVVICFIVCWAPYFITQMWAAFDNTLPYDTSYITTISSLLANLNSCTNPWIYLAFSGSSCKKQSKPIRRTNISSANTYITEAAAIGENMRMRRYSSEYASCTRNPSEREMLHNY